MFFCPLQWTVLFVLLGSTNIHSHCILWTHSVVNGQPHRPYMVYSTIVRVSWVRIPPLLFSLEEKSCPGCSWFVCCAFAFLPRSFHMQGYSSWVVC